MERKHPAAKHSTAFHTDFICLYNTHKPSKSSSWEMLTRLQSLRAHREHQLRLKLSKKCVLGFLSNTKSNGGTKNVGWVTFSRIKDMQSSEIAKLCS